jgi:hypothetical protein
MGLILDWTKDQDIFWAMDRLLLLLLREGGGSYKPKAGKDRKEKKKGADSL